MNAVTVSEMRSIEDAALRSGWTEERLMELAGEQLAASIAAFFPQPGTIIAYLGKGHNAGDALVALRFLKERHHWKIGVRPAFAVEKWAALTRVKSFELGEVEEFRTLPPWRTLPRPLVLLDGLLGIGAKGELREPLLALANEMAWLRQNTGAKVAAIDLPSGVDPDSGEIFQNAVTADVTFMIGAAKTGLLREAAANATGALAIVPVEPLTPATDGDRQLISPFSLSAKSQPRPFNFHKGNAGRIGILAGSPNFSGAAVLAASAALRAGGGLITLHPPSAAAATIAAKCPPEIIIQALDDPREILKLHYDALVIGCGLHSTDSIYRKRILELIATTDLPTVVDAEALNLLAESGDFFILKQNHLLTPHPGEFARLAPESKNASREESARRFTDQYPVTLLLKGCRTLVTRHGETLWHNPTGSPGMATGGQGDLLSGVIGALLAAGNPPIDAAAIGAWICGRAAERALQDRNISEESLSPSDVLAHLGGAFRDWSERCR